MALLQNKYGPLGARYMDVLSKTGRDQGQYDPITGKIYISPAKGDGFIVGTHEAAHARDAAVSEMLPDFDKAPLGEAYNMHSRKVLTDAKKALGLKANSREYKDQLTQIFGNNPRLIHKLRNRPDEIVAYAIDYETSGRRNDLSNAISERFGRC